MKKSLFLCAWLAAAVCHASVQLDTSINDVFHRGTSELVGSITFTVTDNDFSEASLGEPVFIRISPDHGAVLAETLVWQASADPVLRQPINLAMSLDGGQGLVRMYALPLTVAIVRWVAGESHIWIRVQESSDTWLMTPTGTTGPSEDLKVSWTVGQSARISDFVNDKDAAADNSNLPFNTRDDNPDEGDYDEATSTLFCVDLSQSNLLADGSIESLLNYDIIAFDAQADLGGGVYSGEAGNNTGINFTSGFSIARGKTRACDAYLAEFLKSDSSVPLCIYAPNSNASPFGLVRLTKELEFGLSCDAGGNYLDTTLVPGAYLRFDLEDDADYGFYNDISDLRFLEAPSYATFENPFHRAGYTLYRTGRLVYNGDEIPTSQFNGLTVEISVWMYYLDPPTGAYTEYSVHLLNHAGPYDSAPYYDPSYDEDGDFADQNRRCAPSEFVAASGSFYIGRFDRCEGLPVSLFFPYLPVLTENNQIFAGFSSVNTGAADLDIEAVFYDENGNRFTASLGTLGVRQQKTWILYPDAQGHMTARGVGGNNADEAIPIYSDYPEIPDSDFGRTHASMFLRGTFETDYFEERYHGDLDGYMLIINNFDLSTYLPRTVDNDIPGQNADLPLWRAKAGLREISRSRTQVTETQKRAY